MVPNHNFYKKNAQSAKKASNMSKMNNNSRKNINKNSSKANKASKKKFKIESLEPRLLMDAATVDWDKIDDSFVNSVDSSFSTLEGEVDAGFNASVATLKFVDDYDVAEDASSMPKSVSSVGDLLSGVMNTIKTDLQSSLKSSIEAMKNAKDAYDVAVAAGSETVTPLPSDLNNVFSTYFKANFKNATFSASSSSLELTCDYKDTLQLKDFKLASLDCLTNFLNSTVTNFVIDAKIKVVLNFDSDSNGSALESLSDISVDSVDVSNVKIKVGNLGCRAKFMNIDVTEQNIDVNDISVTQNASSLDSEYDLEFQMFPTSGLPFSVDSSDYLKIQKSKGGKLVVSFPDSTADAGESLSDPINDALKNTGFSFSELPFIGGTQIEVDGILVDLSQIPDIFKKLDNYWARVSLAINGAVDSNGELDIGKFYDYLDILVDSKDPQLNSLLSAFEITIGTENLTLFGGTKKTGKVSIGDSSNPTEITLRLNPKINPSSTKVDFFLFENSLKSIDLNFKVKLNLSYDCSKNLLDFDFPSLSDFALTMKADVPSGMKFGLLKANLTDGKLVYELKYNTSSIFTSDIKIEYDSIDICSETSYVENKVFSNSASGCFNFNINEGIWEFPSDVQKYASFTEGTFSSLVISKLQSLQNTLRSVVDAKVNLNVIEGSVGSVLDVADKINEVIYDDNGLFKFDDGQYVANFTSVFDFVCDFNTQWKRVFGISSDVCILEYFDDSDKEITTSSGTLEYYILKFDLAFGNSKEFNLDFLDALDKSFLNVSTDENEKLKAVADAKISFELKVDLSHTSLDVNTKLSDLESSKELINDKKYFETNIFGKILSTGEVRFEIVYDEKSKIEVCVNDSGSLNTSLLSPTSNNEEVLYENNQLIVLSDKKFYLQSSNDSGAFAELNLDLTSLNATATTLQTTCTVDCSGTSWNFSLTLKKPDGTSATVNISEDYLKNALDYPSSANIVENLNALFSLQYSDNNNLIKACSSIEKGRSLMNTFGIYALCDKSGTVRLGCDPTRIQNYDNTDAGYTFDPSSSDFKYMRVSGKLQPTGAVGNYSLIKRTTNDKTVEYIPVDLSKLFTVKSDANTEKSKLESDPNLGCLSFDVDDKGSAWQILACLNVTQEEYTYKQESNKVTLLKITNTSQEQVLNEFKCNLYNLSKTDADDICNKINNDSSTKGFFNASISKDPNDSTKYKIDLIGKKIEYEFDSSEKYLKIVADGQELYVDTMGCKNLSMLANKINDNLAGNNVDATAKAVENKIVFSSSSIKKIEYSTAKSVTESPSASSDDFKVESCSIDFQNLPDKSNPGKTIALTDATKLTDCVDAINEFLRSKGCGVTLYMTKPKNTSEYLDHLEFRSTSSFKLENVGSSEVLALLGFVSGTAVEYGTNDFRIVGKPLYNGDWANLIEFDGPINADVNLTLGIGDSIKVATSQITDQTTYFELKIADYDSIKSLKKDSLVYIQGYAYKVIEAPNKPLTGDATLKISRTPEQGGPDAFDLKTQCDYILFFGDNSTKANSTVTATVGFVDVGMDVNGGIGTRVSLALEKGADNNDVDKNFFGYKINTFSPTLFNGSGLAFDADVKIGSITSDVGHAAVSLDVNNNFKLEKNKFNDIITNVTNKFGNFSAEDLFTVLEQVAERLRDIVKQANVKIPLINKSIGDLVNVANDLRDIILKLRNENIYSLQGFKDYFTKYLKDYGLVTKGGSNIFDIALNGSSLDFSFDICKNFSTTHTFNFGNSSTGISGNADLNVGGSFWFSLSATADVSTKSFDLMLDKAVDFGATVNIIGEKLSFDLGLNGITDAALLANLIKIGSNSETSFVQASFALDGGFGLLDSTNKALDPNTYSTSISISDFVKKAAVYCKIDAFVGGELPISALNYSLGEIKIGKCNGQDGVYQQSDANCNYTIELVDGKNVDPAKENSFSFRLITDATNFADGKDVFIIDLSNVYTKLKNLTDGNLDWFDKIKLAVTGLDNLFDTLESKLNSGMMSELKSVPVVGGALSNGADFITVLKDKVLDPFSKFVYEATGMTAEMVARKMSELFGKYLDLDGNVSSISLGTDWNQYNSSGLFYRSSADSAEWFFRLHDVLNFGKNLGFDLGLPGLGLETDGGMNLSLNWTLEFGFGVSKDNGFYFILGSGDEISVEATVNLGGIDILGKLAGLGMKLSTDADDNAKISFGVDLDSSTSLYSDSRGTMDITDVAGATHSKNIGLTRLSNIISNMPEFSFKASALLDATITVGILKDVKGSDAPKFPNIVGDFEFEWKDGAIEKLGFSSMKLDMGSFISGVLGPIVSKIQKVIEPLEPLIDFLTTPFPVLDDLGLYYTPLSLAKDFSKGKFDDSMIYAIKDLIAISKKISTFGSKEIKIDLGDMKLIEPGSVNDLPEKFAKGETSLKNFYYNSFISNSGDPKNQANKKLKENGFSFGNDGGWHFVWDNPSDALGLLLGKDIPLVEYDMPTLTFSFDWDTFIRIYGPLGARLGLSLSASIQIGFGYDTLGIRQWIGSGYKDIASLLNGFYVNDFREGVDVDELCFHGELTAAAEVNAGVKAGVGGGVGVNVMFNLNDPNKDGKIRLGEIKEMAKLQDGFLGIFDVHGNITAKLYAYVDLLFVSKEWNITGDKVLCDFEFKAKETVVLASESGVDVVANVGANSSNRIHTDSDNTTLEDGDEILRLYIDGSDDVYRAKDDGSGKDGDKLGTVQPNGKLIINAGEGNDEIYLYGDASCNIEINGGNGDDLIDLSNLNLDGSKYVLIWGGAGRDVIFGANGGMNVIFGDTGLARIEEDVDDDGDPIKKYVVESNVDSDNSGDDIIIGGSNNDIILGGAGHDQIDGWDGSDIILGDGGKVEIVVPDDSSKISGYELISGINVLPNEAKVSRTDISLDGGNDVLIGGAGDDLIYGGQGDDHINGGDDDDVLYGGKGHDRILGGAGNDKIYGGDGMDIIFGDTINNDSMDLVEPFADNSKEKSHRMDAFSKEFIETHFSNSQTTLSSKEFQIDSQNSSHAIEVDAATKSTDTASFGQDEIYGEAGNDLIFGDSGANDGDIDHIYGGIGNDIIDGDGGDDEISGGIDNDVIYGGVGSDVIDGGAGNDSIYGDEGVKAYSSRGDAFSGDKLVFGDNLGIGGVLYKNAKSNSTESGDDRIITGPGMDFVDGQAGNDTVTVNLMGDSTVNYANVTDSGDSSEVNTLVVEGTEYEDHLLMRRNETGDLGFAALLPITTDDLSEASQNDAIASKNINTNIERINFTNNINVVNIYANGGNDKISVDGTANKTNIDGGAGDDTFCVGQLYNSTRDTAESAKVSANDEFRTVETSDNQYISDGVTKDTRLNIDGGIGNDNFVALNNKGFLNLAGGKNDDTFSLYTFRDKSGEAIERGVVSVDGGKDFDTLNIRGTDGEDTFVVTKEGMLSDLLAVKAAGVESTKFDAAAGDDMFYVLGNKSTDSTELNGGKGNDTFSVGGLDYEMDLRSANTEGQSCEIDYEVVAFDDLEDDQQSRCDSSVTSGSAHETFTIIDTSVEPAVFVSTTDNGAIVTPEISMKKGEQKSFFICCSENIPSSANVNVLISAPMLSDDEAMRGKQGVLLSTDGNTWEKNVEVVFYMHGNRSKTSQKIFIKVLDDTLYEDEMVKSLSISSRYSYNGSKHLNKSVSSLEFKIEGETGFENDCTNIISYTKNVSVSANKTIIWDEVLDGKKVSIYDALGNLIVTSDKFVNNVIDLSSTSVKANDRVVVNVRAAQVHLQGSKLTLAYDEIIVDKVEIASGNSYFELDKVGSSTATHQYSDIVYKVCGNVIIFYNSTTLQQVTLDNDVKVSVTPIKNIVQSAATNGSQNANLGTNQNQVAKTDLLTFTAHTNILAENGNGDHGSVKYNVEYKGNIAAGKSVFVKVTPQQLQSNKNDKTLYERLLIESGTEKSDKGYIILEFTSTKKSIEITVSAIDDKADDDYGYVHVKKQDKVIDDVDGAVYAYGEGASIDLDFDSPAMLSYKHQYDDNGSVKKAFSKNERNDYDMSKLFIIEELNGTELTVDLSGMDDGKKNVLAEIFGLDADGYKEIFGDGDDTDNNALAREFGTKTLKFVNKLWRDEEGNVADATATDFVEDDHVLTVSTSPNWIRIEQCVYGSDGKFHFTLNDTYTLEEVGQNFVFYSVNRDALFVDEAELVDRLFVNNQDYNGSDVKKSSLNAINTSNVAEKTVAGYDPHAVKFNHDDISAAGIVAAQMEYGEYNLGNSKDIVEINKTIYREDGFRTYTVVNTGAEDENGSKPFGSVVATAKMASCETNGDLFHYSVKNYVSAVTNFSYYTSEKYFVEATIKRMDEDGNLIESNVQRREIEYFFSEKDGFNIRYDFILVEGEFIDSFEFFQAEFDDEIKVNHYAADVPSVVICEGVITAAPAEEDDSANLEAEGESAEGESATSGEEGDSADESATSGEESDSDEEEIFGTKYYYAFSEGSSSDVYNSKMTDYETAVTAAENDGILKPSIFVDATMSDGSVQRREVSELAPDYFIIARDFTFTSENMTIESLKFGFNYNGDGQLVINAQSGNDKIDASESTIDRNDMIIFGGLGDDYITMNKGGIAFGDRGQILVRNYEHEEGTQIDDTVLGFVENGDYSSEYTTGISKEYKSDTEASSMYRLQTDGVNRGAENIHSMDEEHGGVDTIYVGGSDSVVIGGAKSDVIAVGGNNNVVLGDNGSVQYNNVNASNAVYGDNLNTGLHIVETTANALGSVDNVVIAGDKNVAMGGQDNDCILISGTDNIVVGDGGCYRTEDTYQVVETKSDVFGGQDFITTGDGRNIVMGGTDADQISTGKGNDVIVGDGGLAIADAERNVMFVTNEHRNVKLVDKNETLSYFDDNSAGADNIKTTGGDNVIFGGLKSDNIQSGDGQDKIFGDNGYATFRGNADIKDHFGDFELDDQNFNFENAPEVKTKSTLSFNFQGTAQNGLGEQETAGAGEYAASHWNNISGSIAGTFGNDDSEIVRFDDGTRASAVSVSYSGYESHRNTSTDNAINLQAYNLGLNGANYDSNKKLMNSGLMTTAPSDQCDNRLDVSVDGLAQYFTGFDVVVYLDIPDSHSWADQSVRRVGLWIDGIEVDAYYVNDKAGLNYRDENYVEGLKEAKSRAYVFDEDDNITGSVDLTSDSAKKVAYANYVVFHVKSDTPVDRIVVRITDGFTKDNINGKDLPGIAGIQIQGTLHKQDIAASTDITFGDKDIIHSNGGDDIVVGGTGSDEITTYGDERKGIYDNDVVFGDNAMLLFTDRDSNDNTASTLTTAESITATNKDAEYNDIINTGDGNDVVVGGIGSDTIKAGATNDAEKMLDDVKAWSLNFTNERSDSSNSIKSATYKQIDYGNYVKEADGETAGVVADNDWCNMYLKNGSLHKTVACDGNENQFKGIDVSISAYRENDWNKDNAGNYSITHENYDELDGDTANSKLFNFYLAAQQQEEMRITLRGIHNQVGDAKYDLYVYLGGDNADTDTYNYLYQISLNNSEFRYLNDWTGNTFDGDYKEATCDNDYIARCLLHDYATPRIELVGNYVVFRNLTGDVADIRIKNIYSFGGQSPKNLPVVSAIQIVSGAAKDSAAIGGDHDKDLVFGDDAKLTFDLDIPYSSEENLPDYKNRVIEAKSKDVGSLVNSVLTNDIIDTGKDRDVVVGGEDGDKITTGSGDDIAIGGGANLILEHNNPVGVFTPNTEIVLDQHTIDQTIHRNYLDNDNANIYEMQNRIDRNDNSRIRGINTNVLVENDRLDTIDAGEGRNLVSQRNTSTEKLIKEENPVAPTSDYKPSQETGDIEIGSSPVTVHILANQTIKLVCKSGYPVGNQYWTPDVKIRVNNSGNGMIPVLTWEWDEAKGRHVETSNKDYYIVVNIPDHPNTDEGYVIYVTSKEDATISVTVAE